MATKQNVTPKQVSVVVNDLVKNISGAAALITEDLTNIADYGQTLQDLSQAKLIDNMEQFVRGISAMYWDNRMGEKRTLGLKRSKTEFAGIVQRVKMAFLEAEETDVYNLEKYSTAQKLYNRGQKWDGYNFDVRVFTKDVSYRVVHQIALKEFITAMNDKAGAMSFVAMIEATAQKTMDVEEYALELAMVSAMIAGAKNNEIALLTMYKTDVDPSYNKSAEQSLEDPAFMRWAGEVITEVQKYALDPNKKYAPDGGNLTTWVPASDLKTFVLNKFISKYGANLEADTFNMGKVSLKVDEIVNCWNGTGTDLYPSLATVGKVDVILEGDEAATTIENVISVCFDSDALNYVEESMDTFSDWNGDGGFSTIYSNKLFKQIIDPRNTAIVFTLN